MPRSLADDRHVSYFAAFLDLLRKKVVVVGGGRVATTKVRALLPCQPAPLVVVAPHASASIRRAHTEGQLVWHPREYQAGDLHGAALVFGASDNRALNARVASDARALGIPVLAVDDVPNCDFIAPALVRRGDLTLAISTNGRSPAMARRTRELLDQTLPKYWGDLLDVAATARERLGGTRSVIEADGWQAALGGEVEHLVSRGALSEATDTLVRKLERSLFETSDRPQAPDDRSAFEAFDDRDTVRGGVGGGFVSLVGAGPGDPDLLTLRALRRLQAAEVVVHDRLIGDGILELASPGAERVDVGKRPGGMGASQSEINALLIELARQGRHVVRLKGGDPFVFGRGGEEALALARAGVPFEVVPGVSAALAAPAAAGIPVTHRGLSASVTIVNGHDAEQHDWYALSRSNGTLVFLMAVERLEDIVDRLLAHGRPPAEPAALIEWATTPRQRVIAAPLDEIVATARVAGATPPAVLVVGPTASLAAVIGPHRKRTTKATRAAQNAAPAHELVLS